MFVLGILALIKEGGKIMPTVELKSIPVTIRREIANNEKTGVDVLEALLTDDDPYVRRNVAFNNSIPSIKLFDLLNDDFGFVRKAAKIRLETYGYMINNHIKKRAPIMVKRVGKLNAHTFKDLFLNPEVSISEISKQAGVSEGSIRTYASKMQLKNPRKRKNG